jgi:twitching motility protein PilT
MLESRRLDDRWISRSFPPAFRRALPAPPSNSTHYSANKAPHKAQSAKPGAKDSPSLEAILRIANDAGHSDVHLGVGERPRFRARGEIQATD